MAKTTRKELRRMKEHPEGTLCPRCRTATLRWVTSSWHCARCGYHEGCCG